MYGDSIFGRENILILQEARKKHNLKHPDKIVHNMQLLKLASLLGIERTLKELEEFSPEFYRDINQFFV